MKSHEIYTIGIILALVAVIHFQAPSVPSQQNKLPSSIFPSGHYDPCCAYPCQNGGICVSDFGPGVMNYTCDCTGTSYYGTNCDDPSLLMWIKKKVIPTPDRLHHLVTRHRWFWNIINNISFLHRAAIKYVYLSRGNNVDTPVRYESDHSYITTDAYFNESYYARALPPVPDHCPTPMGVYGHTELPDIDELIEKVFLRRKFKPDPHGTNVLFQYYAQHFSHQFFITDYKRGPHMTKGNGGVDVSNIYGLTADHMRALRSGINGKLRTQAINGEDFPPYLRDVKGITMAYPPHLHVPEDGKFALGHEFFVLLPGLFVIATIWVREHNRVCDILKKEHPHWDDERLYHTAKLIITGEVIKITIEEYVMQLSQYNVKLTFDPELIHGTNFQFHNRIRAEFGHLYHWHPLVPDGITINGSYYSLMEMAFNTKPVFKHGMNNFIDAMINSPAGALTHGNHAPAVKPVIKKLIGNTRSMRIQSLNAYRKSFQMQPFESFHHLTGDKRLASILEGMYGHIDAVEFFVGLFVEKPGPSVTSTTVVNIGGPWSIKGLIANPICSPQWWKPSTFGGDVGFNIIKTATLKNLFCRNMKDGYCPEIAFSMPRRIDSESTDRVKT